MTASSASTSADLVWSLDEARDMVEQYAVWPSFLGNRVALEAQHSRSKEDTFTTADKSLVESKKMEALLWTLPAIALPEQRSYIQQVRSQANRKRQRNDDDISDSNGGGGSTSMVINLTSGARANKRQRTTSDHDNQSILSSLYYRVADWSRSFWRVLGFAQTRETADTSVDSEHQESGGDVMDTVSTIDNTAVHVVTMDLQEKDMLPAGEEHEETPDPPSSSNEDEELLPSPTTSTPSLPPAPIPSLTVSSSASAAIPFQHVVYGSIRDSHSSYVLMPGDVYGGEYSVYKDGDPTNTHSTATVRVLQEDKISARSLLAFSRVQNQVSKGACLAFPVHSQKHEEGTASMHVGEGQEDVQVQILTFQFRGVKEH